MAAATGGSGLAGDGVFELKTGLFGLGKHYYIPFSAVKDVTTGGVFLKTDGLGGFRFVPGRSAIRVRITFTPVKIPLFPGHPLPELAWSELRYDAYCWVMPASNP